MDLEAASVKSIQRKVALLGIEPGITGYAGAVPLGQPTGIKYSFCSIHFPESSLTCNGSVLPQQGPKQTINKRPYLKDVSASCYRRLLLVTGLRPETIFLNPGYHLCADSKYLY